MEPVYPAGARPTRTLRVRRPSLTATVIVVSLAFLCGALAAGLPGPRRRLLAAGYSFAAAGLLAAVAVEG